MQAPRERLAAASVNERIPPPRRRESRLLAAVRGLFAFLTILVMVAIGVGGLVGWTMYQNYAADLPSLDGLRTWQPPVMSRVYAGDDHLMAELASERRVFAPSWAIPDIVKRAFIAAEDQNFYTHKGVDPFAIARAAYTDVQHLGQSRRPVGASTITQQVARNMLLASNDLSFKRKVKEALLALRIERTLTKDRILELYLNEIYLGQGSYGVAAAAQTYFNKPLDRLSTGQAAMLAALPKSPTNYNPFRAPDAALARRNWVIDRMADTHAITAAEAQLAHAEALGPDAYQRPQIVAGADWFAEEVRRQLIERFGQDQTSQGGLIVHTSFDPALQEMADRALHAGLMAYDHAHGGWRGPAGHLNTMTVGSVRERGNWPEKLASFARPPGMLPSWKTAVVLGETGSSAKLGWLDDTRLDGPPEPVISTLPLAGLGWARTAKSNGEFAPAPHRMADVAGVGDVVMIEPLEGDGDARGRSGHVVLRQIPSVAGALVSLDPHTGRVLAMSGGWSAERSQFNRATQAQRQPGSSFKPFVYLTAMEQGISPSARFTDAPFSLGDWHPNNYEMTYGGPTPLHIALEQSLNLVTVRLAQHIGMDAVAKTAIAYHLVDSMPRVLPAALGAVETTVMREAGGYAGIAEGGRVVVPSLIDSVQDRDGRVVWRPPGLSTGAGDAAQPPSLSDGRPQVADEPSAFQVLKMMEGVVLNGTGVSVGRGMDRPIAGKTGTSQDYNDAWFAGFTPDLVTVVWVGFDNPQTLGDKQDGAHVAGPIWRSFMQAALAGRPAHDFRVPDGVTIARWGCGPHECVDAFKPDQEPGAGGVGGNAVAGRERDNDDPGASTVTMMNADPEGAAAVAGPPAPDRGSGTGVDSGVGGLY